jgi:SAM-dependent methyltransferase
MPLTEENYAELKPFRSRGLRSLSQRIGDVHFEIQRLLAKQIPIRVMELGCGFGTTLLELAKRYNGRIELFGLNKDPSDGDRDIVARSGRELGLLPTDFADSLLPTIRYGDAGIGIPYPDGHFDLVISQMCFLYIADKMQCLREVSRILAVDGVALLDIREYPGAHWPQWSTHKRIEIWSGATEIDFWDYVAGSPGLERAEAAAGPYLRLTRSPNIATDLELVRTVDLSAIHKDWIGTKSVYRMTDDKAARPA